MILKNNREATETLMREKINRLEQNGKNVKCGGVLRALKRELRNMERDEF